MDIPGANWITVVNALLGTINAYFDTLVPWAVLAFIFAYDVHFFVRNRKKRDVLQQEIIWILIEIAVILVFWFIPETLFKITGFGWIPTVWRWGIVFLSFIGIAYFYGHEHGEMRWLRSALGHFGVILLGWYVNRWAGILFFSFPLILAYYARLYKLAMVVLPASNPEDGRERWKRFIILASYSWGCQFPILVVADHAWKPPETRIKGDFTRDYNVPGLIWTKSHQVVGITGGTQFNRVDGPGIIFTGKLERPFQVIDLRMQIRSNEINVVSKDGLSFSVVVVAGFRMDPETWDNKTYARLRAENPLLQDAKELSHTSGSFRFSHRRIQAAFGTTSYKTLVLDKAIPWDQWALSVINEETRKIVSQKNLDELWRPVGDEKGDNAMDEIAKEIKARSEWKLRSKGILLLVSRIVNFKFPANGNEKMSEISKQQIATWGAEWERKRAQKLADAEASANRDQQEARAYAESQLLNSIADALQKTHDIDPELNRHVIAMRYLSALQDYAHKNTPEEEEKIKELHNSLRGM